MSIYTLRLTCCCGGEMVYAGTHTPYLVAEREAFNLRHAECKPLPAPGPHDRVIQFPVDFNQPPADEPLNRRTT